ncbi:toxin-antitoxin system YwqK family antitoxin [Altericroceibacterium spongiae]|uniref:Toxin-antitoxin system YwqK family antitoxin n=1 Tax=Altericroceibacterium spongiae TaxID=2320269 RepID=A0A420EJE1_9SPHN|nr:toxin-antitoxin system YwqK family antitoxin [Altericroceibacterium spongiae]RKF20788.1 toxin-antitoxin system YwqK family antitoxin [Altericroceibacterium spongiae]
MLSLRHGLRLPFRSLSGFLSIGLAALVPLTAHASPVLTLDAGRDRREAALCTPPEAGSSAFTGTLELRREDGSLQRRLFCRAGRKDGLDRSFFPDGTLAEEEHWKEGALFGPYRSWFADGTLEQAWRYGRAGLEGLYRTYHPNGMLAAEVHWRDGKRDGPYADYDRDGHPIEAGTYAMGHPDGPVTEWYASGAIKSTLLWKDGRRVGTARLWGRDGSLLRETRRSADGRFLGQRVWQHGQNGHGRVLWRVTEPVTVPQYGPGLKTERYEGPLTYTTVETGADDPAELSYLNYVETDGLYKLETLHCGDRLVDRVEAFDHTLIPPVIHRDRDCPCPPPQD